MDVCYSITQEGLATLHRNTLIFLANTANFYIKDYYEEFLHEKSNTNFWEDPGIEPKTF